MLLKVYDEVGTGVATLVDGMQDAGMRLVNFDGGKLSAGTYYYRLSAANFSDIKKMILVK